MSVTLHLHWGYSPLLGVDEVGEFCRIAQKEDGGIVVDHIPVAFIRAELDRKSTRISSAVMATTLSAYRS